MSRIVKIEISARHIHLTELDYTHLFGEEPMDPERFLSQPGNFKAKQFVSIKGPAGELEKVSIVGPFRDKSQVEITLTEARILGLKPPIRISGDLEDSESCKVIGPQGELELKSSVIIAKRHLHISVEEARKVNLENKEMVQIQIKTPERALIFDDVCVRVAYEFVTAVHIDTDEANAANCSKNIFGEIIKKVDREK